MAPLSFILTTRSAPSSLATLLPTLCASHPWVPLKLHKKGIVLLGVSNRSNWIPREGFPSSSSPSAIILEGLRRVGMLPACPLGTLHHPGKFFEGLLS